MEGGILPNEDGKVSGKSQNPYPLMWLGVSVQRGKVEEDGGTGEFVSLLRRRRSRYWAGFAAAFADFAAGLAADLCFISTRIPSTGLSNIFSGRWTPAGVH